MFLSLGFAGFYSLWAIIVGALAIFGLKNRKKVVRNLLFSWFLGIFLISASPTGSIVAAVFIRIFATGFLRIFQIRNEAIVVKNKPIILVAGVGILIVASIASAVFAPPLEVEWYKMNNVSIVRIDKTTTNNTLTLDDIKGARIVSQEYALQIPKTMVTETGWHLSYDWDGIYPINNTLYWVIVYEPSTLINSANPSPAYILVNSEDPADRKKIIESIPFSEERSDPISIIYQIINGGIRDVKIKLWLTYPFFSYGDTIFTHDELGNPVWIAPVKLDIPTFFLVKFYTEQVGVALVDDKGFVKFYSTEEIRNGNAPDWLEKQILIDEDYTEMRVRKWAKYKYWKGFLNYHFQHENVFETVQDLYFLYDKPNDRRYALLQLEPEGYERKAITHFIDVEASARNFGNITIYDVRGLDLIGPERALDDVRGEISIYKNWYALQPIFKKIKGGYYYVVPVYSGQYESMVLRAVAVVDAKTEKVTLFKWGEIAKTSEKQTDTNVSLSNLCKVVSSKKVNGKLRLVIECE